MNLSMPSLKKLWSLVNNHCRSQETKIDECSTRWLLGISLIISVVLLFVCSKNSLINPMNDSIDENHFFATTDALFHGCSSILMYVCHDYGFFKSSDTYPQIKYFADINLVHVKRKIFQDGYIKSEIVNFVITPIKPEKLSVRDNISYKMIEHSEDYFYNGNVTSFYLYGRQANPLEEK